MSKETWSISEHNNFMAEGADAEEWVTLIVPHSDSRGEDRRFFSVPRWLADAIIADHEAAALLRVAVGALRGECRYCAEGLPLETGSEEDYDEEDPRHEFMFEYIYDGKPTAQFIWRYCELKAASREALATIYAANPELRSTTPSEPTT